MPSCDRSRCEQEVRWRPTVSHRMGGIELTRWSAEERIASMETMKYQSAPMAERWMNSKIVSQAWGKITESTDIMSFGGSITKSLSHLALKASSCFQSYSIPPPRSRPSIRNHPVNSPLLLHLAESSPLFAVSVMSNREDGWPSCT